MVDDKGSKCNILICGYNDNCGQKQVQNIIASLPTLNQNKIRIEWSSNFFKIFPIINTFHYIILCRRNVQDFTSKHADYSKYIEMYNCWSLFASIIVPYEATLDKKISIIENHFKEHHNVYNTNSTVSHMKVNNYII